LDERCKRSSNVSNLNIRSKFTNNVSCGKVLADVIFGFSVLSREDAITLLDSTAQLLRALPHDLGEMRGLRVIAVVFTNFICP